MWTGESKPSRDDRAAERRLGAGLALRRRTAAGRETDEHADHDEGCEREPGTHGVTVANAPCPTVTGVRFAAST